MVTDLTDSFGRRVTYLRISLTDRCNFRCVYCMPEHEVEHLARPDLLTYEEIAEVVEVFARAGVTRVRLTGGEPLLRAEVPRLVAMLKAIEGIERVALTTNAFLLRKNARALAEAGLDSLNISLDSLDDELFRRISRVGTLERVIGGIDAAAAAGFEPIKLNAVVMGGVNDHELTDLVAFAAQRRAIMRFIEFMPIGGDTAWGEARCVPAAQMRERLSERWEVVPDPSRYGTGPARYMRVHGPEFGPEGWPVGIISAVTECFCADCNRVRISPQGGLRACLADDHELDLRAVLRSAEPPAVKRDRLLALIGASLGGKRETHSFDIEGESVTSTRMHSIGG